MKEVVSHLSATYTDRLAEHYPDAIVSQLNQEWREAALLDQAGQTIEYVRINEGAGSKPVLYIPGFTEGIVAKAPFAVDLASRGLDVILPDQNRTSIIRNQVGKKDATYTQAANYLAVLEAEGLLSETNSVDTVTHSYGSLIFDEMIKIAKSKNLDCFDDSKVIMLAPAGLNDRESRIKLGSRFLKLNITEGRTPKDIGDDDGEMLKAGTANFRANMSRAVRECLELATRHIDEFNLMGSGIGSLAIVGYAEDVLFPSSLLESAVERLVNDGATWLNPVDLATNPPRSGRYATHNDEQFNPSRVAGSVAELLKL